VDVYDDLRIGRDPSSDLTLQGRLVSRHHAVVRAARDGLEIEDISRHGTLVDSMTLHRARLQVGPECTLFVGCVRLRLRRLLVADAHPLPTLFVRVT
jgi:predicted component of type VI protein secretion system